jgi:hypothetical protein
MLMLEKQINGEALQISLDRPQGPYKQLRSHAYQHRSPTRYTAGVMTQTVEVLYKQYIIRFG